MRFALITNGTADAVAAYLPLRYVVLGTAPDGTVVVGGEDYAGWTLDGYVLPRLASGLYGGREVTRATAELVLSGAN